MTRDSHQRRGKKNGRLWALWHRLTASLWFVPGVILFLFVGLAVILLQIDHSITLEDMNSWSFIFGASASGARSMLTAIAGSMVTVAGVVFSITLVALSLASSQYSPRVLRNFMADRTNQVVLGVFVGVFAYCLIVLRAVRGDDSGAFVPSISVFGGFLLSFLAIGYLIYFIHHISLAIQASTIMARVTSETIRNVDRLFPEELGTGGPRSGDAHPALPARGQWATINADRTGYLTGVDPDTLLDLAIGSGIIIRMERAVGEFCIDQTALASVHPAESADQTLRRKLRRAFEIGNQRTPEQDPAFGVQQLVDVAVKALSPGVNDPTTASMAIDSLTAILLRLATRRMESPYRYTDRPGGELRVIARVATFDALVHLAYDQIRRAGAQHPEVLDRLSSSLATLELVTSDGWRRAALLDQAEALLQTAMSYDATAERDRRSRTAIEALVASLTP